MKVINIQPEDWQRITGEYTHLPTKVFVAPQALTKHDEECLRIGKLLMGFLQSQNQFGLYLNNGSECEFETLVLIKGDLQTHVNGCDVEDGNIADMLEKAIQKFEEEDIF